MEYNNGFIKKDCNEYKKINIISELVKPSVQLFAIPYFSMTYDNHIKRQLL